ncbi:uncharacterized protein PHACADRAFT_191224 [Phanerochaete carnosa HHB-10118-sp]|uniref:Uncharacterized protein n=1 Tax=Phanerochaete carnosa (strain HHB-10118-sp) TaxID=650164 RepID=K5WHU4_PHACS|nr:uncharacterized protein PHACADRAFT_191224 [Phanerochaete carnosa HHB-10118-sp]EKM58915.1 hypothetical protein PHACADRAFT_191224 [Phanerochaete carnosa HHB-10118-sp]
MRSSGTILTASFRGNPRIIENPGNLPKEVIKRNLVHQLSMPKYTSKNFVVAKNESLGVPLLERIQLSPENERKFKNIGKPAKRYQPYANKPIAHKPLAFERCLELLDEAKKEAQRRQQAADDLLKQRRAEAKKIGTRRAYDDLVRSCPDLFASEGENFLLWIKEIEETSASLTKLKFMKKGILRRCDELLPTLVAVNKRFFATHDHLVDAEELAKAGKGSLAAEQVHDLLKLLDGLSYIKEVVEDKELDIVEWGNTEWRRISGLCRRLKKVHTEGTDFYDICKTLLEGNYTIPVRFKAYSKDTDDFVWYNGV